MKLKAFLIIKKALLKTQWTIWQRQCDSKPRSLYVNYFYSFIAFVWNVM